MASARPINYSNISSNESFCLEILYYEIPGSRISYWDVCLLVVPALFGIFLIFNATKFYSQLRSTSTPMITTFFILVCIINTAVMLRAIISMILDDKLYSNDIADRVLWLIMRFFLLANEMSIIVFGLASARLDSRSSIRRVLLITSFIAFSYSLTQFVLELRMPDKTFHVESRNYSLYGHGGVLFFGVSSLVFQLVYFAIVILPCIPSVRERAHLPNKVSFYIYCGCLSILYLVQSVGCFLLYFHFKEGLCVVNFTVFIYFSLFNPFVYVTFISGYFSPRRGRLAFLYSSYYHLDTDFCNNSARGLINSDDIVRGLDSDLVINDNYLQSSTHFNRNPGLPQNDHTRPYSNDLTESCQISLDPNCDYFSGQSHGKVNSRKSSGDHKTVKPNLQVNIPTGSGTFPALSPAPRQFNHSLLSSTHVATGNDRPGAWNTSDTHRHNIQ